MKRTDNCRLQHYAFVKPFNQQEDCLIVGDSLEGIQPTRFLAISAQESAGRKSLQAEVAELQTNDGFGGAPAAVLAAGFGRKRSRVTLRMQPI